MGITLTVSGIEEAVGKLQDLEQLIPSAMGDALAQIGDELVSDMTSNCPVDTGYLQSSISITEQSEETLEVTSEAGYSGFVNYGTWKMAPQPYFSDAVENITGTAGDIAKDALSNILG